MDGGGIGERRGGKEMEGQEESTKGKEWDTILKACGLSL